MALLSDVGHCRGEVGFFREDRSWSIHILLVPSDPGISVTRTGGESVAVVNAQPANKLPEVGVEDRSESHRSKLGGHDS